MNSIIENNTKQRILDKLPEIWFSHYYYKLNNKLFTTIRGKTWLKKFNVDDIVKIKVNKHLQFTARIYKIHQTRINMLTLDFLKRDGDYPGAEIESYQNFLDLMNKFRRLHKAEISSIITVFYLEKFSPITLRPKYLRKVPYNCETCNTTFSDSDEYYDHLNLNYKCYSKSIPDIKDQTGGET